MKPILWLPALAMALGGCMPLGPTWRARSGALAMAPLTVYQDSTGPLSYAAPTPRDAARKLALRQVTGVACQTGLRLPLGLPIAAANDDGNQLAGLALGAAWDEGGYRAALAQAQTSAGAGALLFDIRADLHVRQVLTVWVRQCVEVTARVLE